MAVRWTAAWLTPCPDVNKGRTIGNFLKNEKVPQPQAHFLKFVENDSSHQNNNFRLIKTALNNLSEMERVEGKLSYSCITVPCKHNTQLL